MSLTIYHNCNCSKSRATLEILKEAGVDPQIVEYLQTPPSKKQLREILQALGKSATDVIRFGESAAKELGIASDDVRSEGEWLQIMVDNPILIQRPIVVAGDKAVIGRPPELVKALLD